MFCTVSWEPWGLWSYIMRTMGIMVIHDENHEDYAIHDENHSDYHHIWWELCRIWSYTMRTMVIMVIYGENHTGYGHTIIPMALIYNDIIFYQYPDHLAIIHHHKWIPWPPKHITRHQNQCPSCLRIEDINDFTMLPLL